MIVMRYRLGRCAPVIICDVCQQRIVDGGMAAVVTNSRGSYDEDLIQTTFVHKGQCHKTAEDKLGGNDGGWTELTTFLARLVVNSGIRLESFGKELDLLSEIDP